MPFARRNVQPVSRSKIEVDGPILPAHIHACGARESETMLARYQKYVQRELGAQQCFWLATYRGAYGRERWQDEKMHGWKVVAFATPVGGDPDFVKQQADAYLETVREKGPDLLAEYALAHSGETRVHSLADVQEERASTEDWIDPHHENQDVVERIVGVYNLSPICESYILVGRKPGEPPFGAREIERLRELIKDFPRVHHWLALERGLVAPATKPFSPRERDVVLALLGPESENEIADRLEISRGTVHNYVVDVFRNLGVSSRHEMIQLWLETIAV